ncbi:sugar porter family MFS transporter [Sinomicrobium weinanense]|uniref:Sugar porter family MFS transporter n=1 Tax=Sinomicrobium weinanense TaxID=2842200 RepID=A0A926Q5A3_9FLAO|nr:sugar porter family MFS transporter [Sinomicrobium weinanense]MBC9797936.1 sugar porter family MFS transporter [Sinomicrobium weinanense]MBU3123272.1 sugar porter family MFS transporter [Sinomicrobium weinanense]
MDQQKNKTVAPRNYIIRITVVAALGGLLFGYDTAVIAGAIGYLQEKFVLSPVLVGWAASSAIWGCILGAAMAGYVSDRFGRKKILIATGVLFLISALGSAVAVDLSSFVIARLVGGIGVGAASMLSPLYISEVAPAKHRGRLVSIYQLAIVFGINIIYIVNYLISVSGSNSWNVDYGWRYMIGSEAIPAVIFFVLLFSVPESPRWLLKNGRDEKAGDILQKINGDKAGAIKQEIQDTLKLESGRPGDLFGKGLRLAFVVGIVLALFSQITGINAVIYFAPEIFKSIGFGVESAFYQTIFIGVINTIFTFVALWLIDRAGRKKLLVWGVSGMILCLCAIGICFYFEMTTGPWLILFVLGFIACFASSLGPVPWVMISEIFPTKIRGIAMSFCTLVLWIGVILITQLTPVMLDVLGGASTFWIFMCNAVILLLFTLKYVPETRGRSLEQIERSWTKTEDD